MEDADLMARFSRCFNTCCTGFSNQLAVYALLSNNCTMYDSRIEIEIEPSNELKIGNCDELDERAVILDCFQRRFSL